jgi:hypothetical protein
MKNQKSSPTLSVSTLLDMHRLGLLNEGLTFNWWRIWCNKKLDHGNLFQKAEQALMIRLLQIAVVITIFCFFALHYVMGESTKSCLVDLTIFCLALTICLVWQHVALTAIKSLGKDLTSLQGILGITWAEMAAMEMAQLDARVEKTLIEKAALVVHAEKTFDIESPEAKVARGWFKEAHRVATAFAFANPKHNFYYEKIGCVQITETMMGALAEAK